MGLLAHGQEREPRLPSYDDIDKLPYLNSVSLRPVAPAPWPPPPKSLLMMCRPPLMRLPACLLQGQATSSPASNTQEVDVRHGSSPAAPWVAIFTGHFQKHGSNG